jgi:hypothetical protein
MGELTEMKAPQTAVEAEEDAAPAGEKKQPEAGLGGPRKLLRHCKECPFWGEIKERARVSVLVAEAVEKYEERLNARDFKPTVAEFLKLLQLEKELEDKVQDKEIHVKWIGPEANPEPSE